MDEAGWKHGRNVIALFVLLIWRSLLVGRYVDMRQRAGWCFGAFLRYHERAHTVNGISYVPKHGRPSSPVLVSAN
jgi:hypothetical protein